MMFNKMNILAITIFLSATILSIELLNPVSAQTQMDASSLQQKLANSNQTVSSLAQSSQTAQTNASDTFTWTFVCPVTTVDFSDCTQYFGLPLETQ